MSMAEEELHELSPEELEALRAVFFKEISAGPTEELQLVVHPHLEKLMNENPDIMACFLVDSAGMPVDHVTREEKSIFTEEFLVVVSANIWGLFAASERESIGLNLGHVRQVIARTSEGFLCITKCGESHALAAIARPRARLGVVLRDLGVYSDLIAKKISEISQ